MTVHPPLWSSSETIAAAADRQLISKLFPVAGVADLTGGDLKVSQRAAGANMSVDVAPGVGIIEGTDAAGQGRAFGAMDAIVNLAVNAAPGAGTSRIDRIGARWFDSDVLGGASSWTPVYVAGVAAASPSPPALPNSTIPLAQFTVLDTTTQITTGMITDQRVQAGILRPGPDCLQLENTGNITLTTSYANLLGASLSVPAGTWLMYGNFLTDSSVTQVRTHKGRIQNTTDATTVQEREEYISPETANNKHHLCLSKRITIAATKSFQLQGLTTAAGGTQLKTDGILIATRVNPI